MRTWIESVAELSDQRRDHVLVTLTAIRGSAPQIVGSKMVVTSDGLLSGTVGGGKIEAHCIQYAQALLSGNSPSELRTWNLQTDIGMSCGGEMTLFFDCNFFSGWNVALFGAGHIVQELCRVMQSWSCHIWIFDNRAEWLERLPKSANITAKLSATPAEEIETLPSGTFILSITQGHATDLPILHEALKELERFPFVGVIGSQVKGIKIRRELKSLGLPTAALDQLICPLGLPFGNNTPPEIAISIAAQILSERDKNSSFRPKREGER